VKSVHSCCYSLLFVGVASSVFAATPGPLPPAADQQLGREILKELVETNTTHALGSTGIAKAIERRLHAAGFQKKDVVVLAPPDHPSKGNVVVRYHGKGSAKPVLFLGHLDVVEAKREDWSFDPFILTEREGWFYGRGTIDMKNGDAALVETLIRLKREGFVPDRDIICAFTADEEPGGDANGPDFLLKSHREMIDAEFAVNLDGNGAVTKDEERFYFRLFTSEKTYVTYTIESTSAGGHGSLPGADNAIYRVADGLGRLESYKFPVMLTTTTRASFAQLAKLYPRKEGADMSAVAASPPDLAAAERLSQTVLFNAQLRTTCVATLISGGHAENALPQRAKATIQCRMMPGDTAENVQATIVRVLNDPKITIRLDAPPISSPESPLTPQLAANVEAVVHSMWPGVPVVPVMATWFTDGRHTRSAGIPTYDLAGVWLDANENRAHGRDERVSVRAYDESVEYTYRLVKAMSKAN
jgi:acetylornithine deacetylase/succinyl-diaminopimelate desuccinylase-like protein